jgi:hypothetical protein
MDIGGKEFIIWFINSHGLGSVDNWNQVEHLSLERLVDIFNKVRDYVNANYEGPGDIDAYREVINGMYHLNKLIPDDI